MTPERSERIPGEPEPDAVAKGWVVPPGGSRVEAIFVLSGTSLGIGRVERATTPVWLDLRDLDNLDAIGDPVDGLTEVEIRMHDERVIGAGWTDAFCEAVVAALQSTAPGAPPAPSPSTAVPAEALDTAAPGDASPDTALPDTALPDTALPDTASPDAAPSGAPALAEGPEAQVTPFAAPPQPDLPPVATEPEPSPAPVTGSAAAEPAAISATGLVPVVPAAAAAAAPVVGAAPQEAAATPPAAALELEDVVYLGGYPGQTKRRKKCIVSMSRSSLELKGPSDLHFRIGWDVVRTIEVQNADEARFRMNTKIHRDASALVLECDQGVTVLLEARDCPTVALRSAINQLLDGLPVVVV